MKISYNWLKSHIDIPFSIEELKDTLTDIGLEVEAVEPFESIKGGLKGLITGHVIEKEKHSDADKLSVCKVDTGTEILQIVCGAPNVAAGQKVIVATVGSTVYPTNGEAFAIKKAKIRGVESFGMICAEDEIGLGTAHDGILILDEQTEVGKQVAEIYNVENDYLLEIGLTPNRTDAFSHIGVARDLAACLTFRTKKAYKLSETKAANYLESCKNLQNNFSIEIENKAACPYYSGIVLTDIQVKESPQWLKNRLLCIGQKPINNVVDITNFILHEYGQPLHAFDLNEIKGNKIIVKNLPEKTKFLALDNSTIELHQEDLMICDGNGNGMCIAGVYGGLESGVKNSTITIFLECAYFDPKTIRRTSMRHTLRTESAIHFEKGIDPNIQEKALNHAIHLLTALANAQPASPVYVAQSEHIRFDGKNYKAPFDVTLALSDIHKLTGAAISKKEAEEIAGLLDIQVKDNSTEESLHLAVAPYRTDVYRSADVIEEILRIYGFNNVPIPTKLNASVQFSKHDFKDKLYNKTADFLVARGFFEMMNNSIVKSKQQAALKNENEENWVRLLSSINVELDVMRNNMLFSGLESVAHNINHKNPLIQLFEFGKTYTKTGNAAYQEENHLALFLSGTVVSPNWNTSEKKADFYYVKALLESLFASIGVLKFETENAENEIFEYASTILCNGKTIAIFGKVNASLNKLCAIKNDVFYADVFWDEVLTITKKQEIRYKEISKFPAVRRDLALLLDKSVSFAEVKNIAEKTGKKLLTDIELFDIYEDEKIGKDKKSYAVSFTFRDTQKTLQDTEIEQVMNKLIAAYQTELNAQLR